MTGRKDWPCTAVWHAHPRCTGWVEDGHDLHGCKKSPHHSRRYDRAARVHECACGETADWGDELPAPRSLQVQDGWFG